MGGACRMSVSCMFTQDRNSYERSETHTFDPVSNKQSSKTKPLECGRVSQVGGGVSHMENPSRIADARATEAMFVL